MTQLIAINAKTLEQVLVSLDRLAKDVAEIKERIVTKDQESLPMVDEETEKRIGESLNDLKQGRYTTLTTKEDIVKHFKNV